MFSSCKILVAVLSGCGRKPKTSQTLQIFRRHNLLKELCLYRGCSADTSKPGAEGINVNTNSPTWIHDLNNDGYAVVPNVLTHQQCDDVIDQAWQWLAALETGIRKDDPYSWTNDRWPDNFKGIIQKYRIGHAPFVWQTRTNENVINVFKQIWGTEKLLTSFDGMCILRPAELLPRYEESNSYWFHTDQSPMKKGFHCIQGALNLEEVGSEDASFVCYPKSHKLHQELFSRSKDNTDIDFYTLTEDEVAWVEREKGLSHVKAIPPKGSIIVFDSRLLHCNGPAKYPREQPRWRYAIYICMTPRAWADPETLRGRAEAFRKQRMTTHWPHQLTAFPEDPPDVTVPVYEVKLNDVVKRLVGLQDYNGKDENFENDTDVEISFQDRPALYEVQE